MKMVAMTRTRRIKMNEKNRDVLQALYDDVHTVVEKLMKLNDEIEDVIVQLEVCLVTAYLTVANSSMLRILQEDEGETT